MDHKNIIALLARKDRSGLEALYNEYGQKFYHYAVKRWLLNEDEAWDVVYKTLETLVIKLPRYNFKSKLHFDNFLFKVFINFLRQFFRSHRKQEFENITVDMSGEVFAGNEGKKPGEIPAELLNIQNQSFHPYLENEETENPKLKALRKALEQLNEKDRDILLLRAQNYSYDEIAAMLGIENRQLKVRHHRSKQRLIQLLNANTFHHE